MASQYFNYDNEKFLLAMQENLKLNNHDFHLTFNQYILYILNFVGSLTKDPELKKNVISLVDNYKSYAKKFFKLIGKDSSRLNNIGKVLNNRYNNFEKNVKKNRIISLLDDELKDINNYFIYFLDDLCKSLQIKYSSRWFVNRFNTSDRSMQTLYLKICNTIIENLKINPIYYNYYLNILKKYNFFLAYKILDNFDEIVIDNFKPVTLPLNYNVFKRVDGQAAAEQDQAIRNQARRNKEKSNQAIRNQARRNKERRNKERRNKERSNQAIRNQAIRNQARRNAERKNLNIYLNNLTRNESNILKKIYDCSFNEFENLISNELTNLSQIQLNSNNKSFNNYIKKINKLIEIFLIKNPNLKRFNKRGYFYTNRHNNTNIEQKEKNFYKLSENFGRNEVDNFKKSIREYIDVEKEKEKGSTYSSSICRHQRNITVLKFINDIVEEIYIKKNPGTRKVNFLNPEDSNNQIVTHQPNNYTEQEIRNLLFGSKIN